MWTVQGKQETPWFDLKPERVLYDYDGPRIFTCRDKADNLYLAYLCDEDANIVRFLIVAFSDALFEELVTGKIDVLDALTRPRAWLADTDNDGKTVRLWRVDIDDIPSGVLPKMGVMLWKHLPSVMKEISTPPTAPVIEIVFGQPDVRQIIRGRGLTYA